MSEVFTDMDLITCVQGLKVFLLVLLGTRMIVLAIIDLESESTIVPLSEFGKQNDHSISTFWNENIHAGSYANERTQINKPFWINGLVLPKRFILQNWIQCSIDKSFIEYKLKDSHILLPNIMMLFVLGKLYKQQSSYCIDYWNECWLNRRLQILYSIFLNELNTRFSLFNLTRLLVYMIKFILDYFAWVVY